MKLGTCLRIMLDNTPGVLAARKDTVQKRGLAKRKVSRHKEMAKHDDRARREEQMRRNLSEKEKERMWRHGDTKNMTSESERNI